MGIESGSTLEIDSEGRQVHRVAAASKGWVYLADAIELETSKLNSLIYQNYDATSPSFVTLKFFNNSNVELTTQEDIDNYCTKTEIIFKPDFDYEVISGSVHHIEPPTSDVKIWVIGGIIELGAAYVKQMVKGINLKFFSSSESVKTDGRASKFMKKTIDGVSYQGNQLKFIFKHDAGFKHKIMILLEYFRA